MTRLTDWLKNMVPLTSPVRTHTAFGILIKFEAIWNVLGLNLIKENRFDYLKLCTRHHKYFSVIIRHRVRRSGEVELESSLLGNDQIIT